MGNPMYFKAENFIWKCLFIPRTVAYINSAQKLFWRHIEDEQNLSTDSFMGKKTCHFSNHGTPKVTLWP